MKLRYSTALVATMCAAALMATTSLSGQAPTPPAGPAAAQAGAGGRGRGSGDPQALSNENCGGRSVNPETPCGNNVRRMMAALPDSAPATPLKPRHVLVLAVARGFVHSSIPLAARTITEMGEKTGAWSTYTSYDPGVVTAENLKKYDAIFLASTTGTFLDDPADEAVTQARRQALLDFVRGGKGLAGIHAAGDSYHGAPRPAAGAGAAGRGRAGGGARAALPPCTARPGNGGGMPLWPDFNTMIGGYFKFHWVFPEAITVKIDDPSNPINAPFHGKSFNTRDEVYTFNQDSWSRKNVHVLTSIDYSAMSDCDKGLESSPRTDHDFGLSWIRREGNGRVFYEALGHDESMYYNNPAMLQHVLAGMQYVLGDLKADDSPSEK